LESCFDTVIRRYCLFKGERELNVFDNNTALKTLVDTFSGIKQFDNLVEMTSCFEQQSDNLVTKELRKDKKVLFFLAAFFFYIDGVYTIIDMATAYGSALGLNSTGLLLALLVTQLVAFPFAIIFGRLTSKYSTGRLITACIIAYIGITVFAVFMKSQWQFWVLAIFVGMFQGGIQALSRSYFAKIIPAERSGEYFGLMDICGKGASFLGTLVVGAASQIFGSINIGVSMIVLLFTAGLVLFIMTDKLDSKEADLDIENGMIANNSFAEGKAVNN
jgi:UMF1 family MFS transporter